MFFALFLASMQVSAGAPQASAISKEEKTVCETAAVTGSRLRGKRVCFTKAEMDSYKRSIRVMLDQKQRIGYFEEAGGGVCTHVVDKNC